MNVTTQEGESQTRQHRSVSQLQSYERCPYAYYLARVQKVWQRPAAWLAQGSAVHEAVEAWEKSGRRMTLEDAQDVYRESYQTHINASCEKTPNFEFWFRSGPYDGEADTLRRFGLGLEQVERYIRWAEKHPDEVPWKSEDDETLGVELPFDIDLDGVPIRGFIDQVIPNGCGDEVIVRDLKTGNQPGDDFQLGVYAVALSEQYGLFAPTGDYWMGKSGKPTYPYDLSEWTRERVSEKFRELEDNISAERFDPKPDPRTCAFCDVASSCEFSSA